MVPENNEEVSTSENVVESNSHWTEDEPQKKGGRGWLSRPVVSSMSSSKRIQELEQQVRQLSKRPNVFELDEAEITAIAGEDAATLIRAAKAKAQAVLLEAENQARGIKETIASQIAATKAENNRILEENKREIDKQRQDTEAYLRDLRNRAQIEYKNSQDEAQKLIVNATAESNSILETAKSQESRIMSDATKRAEEILTRANSQAQSEASKLLQEAQVERERLREQIEVQRAAAEKLAEESSRVRNSIANFSTTTRQVLNDVLVVATEMEQKTQIIADKTQSVRDSI